MTKILSLEEILAASDLEEQVVEVPEWGGSVRIRAITKGRQQAIRQQAMLKANTRDQKMGEVDASRLEMLLLVESVVEPRLSPEHIPQLREKASGAIERILRAILVLNRLAEDSVEKAEAAFQEGSGEQI